MHESDLVAEGRALGLSDREALELAARLRGLVGVTTVRGLAEAVCAGAQVLLGARGATFVLSEGDEVYYAEEAADDRLWKGRRFPATACISGWAIRRGETALVSWCCRSIRPRSTELRADADALAHECM